MTFESPTGKNSSCNYHYKTNDFDYTKINALDYVAGWGTSILAPFDGEVTYVKWTDFSDRCGNRIRLKGSGGSITICHVKDFLDDSGKVNKKVKQGDVMGHVGGNCCSGEKPPSDWSQANKCTKSGPTCSDPYKDEECSCQPAVQSGNTSGPHIHVSFKKGGNFLACLDE